MKNYNEEVLDKAFEKVGESLTPLSSIEEVYKASLERKAEHTFYFIEALVQQVKAFLTSLNPESARIDRRKLTDNFRLTTLMVKNTAFKQFTVDELGGIEERLNKPFRKSGYKVIFRVKLYDFHTLHEFKDEYGSEAISEQQSVELYMKFFVTPNQ